MSIHFRWSHLSTFAEDTHFKNRWGYYLLNGGFMWEHIKYPTDILEANARKLEKTTKSVYPVTCPLCLNLQIDKTITPYNKNKALLWRNFIIHPNSFPYFKVHFLIQSIV